MRRSTIAGGLLLAACLALAGCGGGGVVVTGKVVNGDKPYSPATDGDVNIALTEEGGQGGSFSGKAEDNGSFTIKDPKGGGVKPGKYKVNVTKYPKAGASPKAGAVPPAPMSKQLPESWDVSSSNNNFTVDLAKLK